MRKIRMNPFADITFEEGCKLYLENCRQRNLREGTINHYRKSYLNFFKFFDPQMKVSEITVKTYNAYVVYLRQTMKNDISMNSYLRDMITTLHFLMNEGYLEPFKMKAIKADKNTIETYTDEELTRLLQKPFVKVCSFTEYECWVITNLLFSTGIRQRSLHFIKVADIDFDNRLLHVRVTKNRKPLIIPLNETMASILKEFLKYRQHKNEDDWLFCNAYGQQLVKSTSYHMLYCYNKNRGVERTGIHRYRHTFAKQWVINGGSVVALSRLLGHSNLSITENYINLLVSDMAKQVDELNLIDKYVGKKKIKI